MKSDDAAVVNPGAPYRRGAVRPPTPPRRARTTLVAGALALVAVSALCALWSRRRAHESASPPTFLVQRPECATRPVAPGGLQRIEVWQSGWGPQGNGATIESNGRWQRREAFPSSQFTPPDEHRTGCVDASLFAPLFAEFARRLAAPAGMYSDAGAPPAPTPADDARHAPCVREYTDARGAVVTLAAGCALSAFAEQVLRVTPTQPPPAPPPAPCTAASCSFEIIVGHVPHPHEGSGATRSATLSRDGRFECETDARGAPLQGTITRGGEVFEWLIAGAASPPEPPPTGTMEPIRRAVVQDSSRRERATIPYALAVQRWNQLAARLGPGCLRAAQ